MRSQNLCLWKQPQFRSNRTCFCLHGFQVPVVITLQRLSSGFESESIPAVPSVASHRCVAPRRNEDEEGVEAYMQATGVTAVGPFQTPRLPSPCLFQPSKGAVILFYFDVTLGCFDGSLFRHARKTGNSDWSAVIHTEWRFGIFFSVQVPTKVHFPPRRTDKVMHFIWQACP